MRILIAEDGPVSRRVLEAALKGWGHEVIIACDGAQAWDVLKREDAPPLAIIDWMMPGMDGLEVCRRVRQSAQSAPTYIILLTAKNRKEDAAVGLQSGADDYLTKPFNRDELHARVQVGARVVGLQRSLAERVRQLEHAEAELRALSLTDDLTELYNRRGFFIHAEQHLKTVRRTGKGFLLFYADMDGLKQINDTFGHEEGSLAIKRMALILRQTFRDSDIIARLGGDEFTALVKEVSPHVEDIISARLEENLQIYNAQGRHSYALSLSTGFVTVASDMTTTLEEQIDRADRAMYEHKRSKRQAVVGSRRSKLALAG
jgi:diguanylate cyclase (GGDEF)-like protein